MHYLGLLQYICVDHMIISFNYHSSVHAEEEEEVGGGGGVEEFI